MRTYRLNWAFECRQICHVYYILSKARRFFILHHTFCRQAIATGNPPSSNTEAFKKKDHVFCKLHNKVCKCGPIKNTITICFVKFLRFTIFSQILFF